MSSSSHRIVVEKISDVAAIGDRRSRSYWCRTTSSCISIRIARTHDGNHESTSIGPTVVTIMSQHGPGWPLGETRAQTVLGLPKRNGVNEQSGITLKKGRTLNGRGKMKYV